MPGGKAFLFGLVLVLAGLAGCAQPTVKYDAGTAASGPTRFDFDRDELNELPGGAVQFSGTWLVEEAGDAPSAPNVVCQTETATFPVMQMGWALYGNANISVRFKALSGNEDRAAGIIFRVQDENNYYILRANALENNVVFFKYAGGSRSTLQSASASVPTGQWQTLRVQAVGNHFNGYLNDALVVQADDSTYAAGHVGLWTKADSRTCFDDFAADPLPS